MGKRSRDDSSDSSSSSDDDRRKEKKSKKSKDHKHKKEKKEKKEKKHKHSSRGGDGRPEGVPSISQDDYFIKNPEYRIWLSSRGKVFGDLSDSETKKYFKKFVEKWNDGELKSELYKGINFADVQTSARTSHKWGFAKKLDTFKSDTLRDQVVADTRSASLLLKPGAAPRASIGPSAAPPAVTGASRQTVEEREQRRAKDKIDRKVERRHEREEKEELAPRPDPGSFQARMEKRAQKGHYCREKEEVEVKVGDLMGGGYDADKARLMKQEAWRNEQKSKKDAEGQAKLEAYQEKERQKMIEFKKMMGLPLD